MGDRLLSEADLAALSRAADVVGDRWSLLILGQVFAGHQRFSELARNLGIARNLLSARLKTLVAAGLLERHAYRTAPTFYEYRLTRQGRTLEPLLDQYIRLGKRRR